MDPEAPDTTLDDDSVEKLRASFRDVPLHRLLGLKPTRVTSWEPTAEATMIVNASGR
jgi:hypothetical protein